MTDENNKKLLDALAGKKPPKKPVYKKVNREGKGYTTYTPKEYKKLYDYPEKCGYRNNPPAPCDVCGDETTNRDTYYDQYFCSNKCFKTFERMVEEASQELAEGEEKED